MEEDAPLRWAVHGRYRLAGVEDLVEVCEVAEAWEGALTRPPSSEKAHRAGEEGTPLEARAPAPAPRPMPAEPVLAVLAFDNLSSDPAMQFFSDGVSEEIIQRLSRGARLKVMFWMATGKWPDCADEVPYDFRAECERVHHVPKEAVGI